MTLAITSGKTNEGTAGKHSSVLRHYCDDIANKNVMKVLVKVVLLANGIGSNPQNYRPNADESQWWNRRDALVRCVTAFFFCSTANNNCNIKRDNSHHSTDCCSSKELIILFDEDWSYFSMQFTGTNTPNSTVGTATKSNQYIPNECNIIQLWKVSALNPGIRIQHKELGLSCLCITSENAVDLNTTKDMETIMMLSNHSHKSIALTKSLPMDINGSDSNKRALLEYMQANCSMEFLRLHKYGLLAAVSMFNSGFHSSHFFPLYVCICNYIL